ncbi:MAG: hypothetical protein ACK4F9_04565 [Brevinematia bacterium]
MRCRAQALIIALMMILVLSIISASLLNFVTFYYLDSSLVYEREKLKLISEKEVLETINLVQKGVMSFTNETKTNTDNFVYKLLRSVSFTNNIYTVKIVLESGRSRIERRVVFFVLLPTDFCYVNLSELEVDKSTKGVFWGYSFVRGLKNRSDDTFFAFYYPPIFSDTTNVMTKSYISSAEISPDTPSLSLNIKYQTNVINEASIRIAVDEIVSKSMKIVDKDWVISRYYGYDIENVYNSILAEKVFLGVFYHSNPKIKVDYETMNNVYFSGKKDKRMNLENLDVFDPRGEITRKFVFIENGYLTFNSLPVEINLPHEAFSKPFKISLNLKNVKLVSRYRKIIGIFLDNTNRNLLDKDVVIRNEFIEMISYDIKKIYYETIAIGDGRKRRFRIEKDLVPQKVFVGDKEVQNFFVENFEVVLPEPPESGKEVIVMKKIPKVFIQKALPPNGINVFSDEIQRAVVIDFDKIQNLPKNKVIFSYLPLVVRGSPNEPIIVVSRENIYVDNINASSNPKSIVLISSKGIFLKEYVETLRNVLIVSGLNGFYRIVPSAFRDPSEERSKWVFGTVILTGELDSKNQMGYVLTLENHINNSTFSISERLASDYISDTDFGKTVRYLIPPIAVVREVK